MQPGQARVVVLLLVLLALEIVVHPAVKTWLTGLINGWNSVLYSAMNPVYTPSGYVPPTSQPSGKQCPPGQHFLPIPGGTTGKCM